MEKFRFKPFLLAKDNFYKDPRKVMRAVLEAEFYEPEWVTGYRSRKVYHEPGVRARIEKLLGLRITRWDTDPELENGVFYQAFSKGKKAEVPGVHADYPCNDVTVLIYLTPGIPHDCGTSLWMHKRTGLCNPPEPRDARRLGKGLKEIREMLERDSKIRNRWVEIDRVGNRFNRMVAYPSGLLHSGSRHYGDEKHLGRVYQTFRIGVDWNSYKG